MRHDDDRSAQARFPPAIWSPRRPFGGPRELPGASSRLLETLLFRIATAVIGLHVADDYFSSPIPARPPRTISSAACPAGVLWRSRPAFPRLRPGARGSRRSRSGCSAWSPVSRACTTPAPSVPPGTTTRASLSLPAGPAAARPRRGDPLALTPARRQPRPALRQAHADRARRHRDHRLPAGARAVRLRLHASGARRGAGREARRALRGREVQDERRPRARGLVHPVEERRGRDLFPGPQGPRRAARGSSRATVTASCSSIAAARARATATRTPTGGGGPRRQGRDRVPAQAPGRGPAAHRRHRPVRGGRDAAGGRGGDDAAQAPSSPRERASAPSARRGT